MYNTWCVNGYGVRVDDLEFELKDVKKLISMAPKFKNEINRHFKDQGIKNPTLDDYLDYDEDYHGEIAYILKKTISEAENIEFSYAENSNNEWFLLLCPSYPWYEMSSEESNLTEEKVKSIIKKYVSVLTDKDLENDIGYQSVENGG